MFGKFLARQKSRKPIQSRTINRGLAEIEKAGRLRVAPPLEMSDTAIGPLIRFAGSLVGVFLAETTTTVTPATGSLPGITPGTGTITFLRWSGSAMSAGTSGITVRNIFKSVVSGQTYTVASGKTCIVFKLYNVYWLIAADC